MVNIAGNSHETDQDLSWAFVNILEHLLCSIQYTSRSALSDIKRAAERIISDKARIARILNGLKNDPFYTHLVTLLVKEFSM